MLGCQEAQQQHAPAWRGWRTHNQLLSNDAFFATDNATGGGGSNQSAHAMIGRGGADGGGGRKAHTSHPIMGSFPRAVARSEASPQHESTCPFGSTVVERSRPPTSVGGSFATVYGPESVIGSGSKSRLRKGDAKRRGNQRSQTPDLSRGKAQWRGHSQDLVVTGHTQVLR